MTDSSPAAAAAPSNTTTRIIAVPVMLLAGGIVAVQSQVNGRLAHELGSGPRAGLTAAVISFGSGLALLTVVVLLLPSARSGFLRLTGDLRRGSLRPHEVLGGVFGAFLVATQGFTVATIGVALFSVAITAGQASSGLLVDHFGIGPSGHQPFSYPRGVAAAFAVVAVLLAAGERLIETFSLQTALFALLPLLAGGGTGIQLALNGRLNAIGGPWATTFNNFAVGTAALLIGLTLSLLVQGHLGQLPGTWWLYTGGVMGVSFICLAALLVKVHGVLVLGLCMIAGQVICAELIEVLGSSVHVGIVGVVAGVLTVVGVLVALLIRPAARRVESV
jgi:bacterial/archaeal transporter family-2 protein